MRPLLRFFALLVLSFVAGLALSQWHVVHRVTALWNPEAVKQPCAPQLLFQPTQYPLENHSFAVVVVGRNNGAYVEKTLQSVFAQNYEKYRLIYVDDASDDGSFSLVRDLIEASKFSQRAMLLQNDAPSGVLASLVRAMRTIPDEEIVVVMHGEDWLAHEWVLQRLNQYYAHSDLWMTFGQSCTYPRFEVSYVNNVQNLRCDSVEIPSLKTFYAVLFKRIHEVDFLYQGQYIPAPVDLAYMLPMLEMAEGHFQCIPEILYVVNSENQEQENSETTTFFERYVRALAPYEKLALLLDPSHTPK